MNELQRQNYLNIMEVDYYHPKLRLPGAAVSVLCDMAIFHAAPELISGSTNPIQSVGAKKHSSTSPDNGSISAKSTAEEPTENTPITKRDNSVISALFDVLEGDSNTRIAGKTKQTQEGVKASDLNTSPGSNFSSPRHVPQFSLSIIRGSNVFIIDDGFTANDNKEAYLRLVHNILFAVHATVQQLTIDTFHWPMVKNNQVDQSAAAAKQALESFLSKHIKQQRTAYVLVMGETAKTYLPIEQNPANEKSTGKFIASEQLGAQLIYAASAKKSLESSALKKQVWLDLQPLSRVLRKN